MQTDQAAARHARRRQRTEQDLLASRLNELHAVSAARDASRRGGEANELETERLERRLAELAREVETQRAVVASAGADLAEHLLTFPDLDTPQRLIGELDDRLPVLLLPVRIETRFKTTDEGRELWVRIFPDDIAVHTHEEELTADEVDAGTVYWREVWAAQQDPATRSERHLGAWRVLAGEQGGPRAAWIADRTRPDSLEVATSDDLSFPVFAPGELKPESWSRAPSSHVMPDRFVVIAIGPGDTRSEFVGEPIPQPLVLGPDPQAEEPDMRQVDGDLAVGEALEWIYDFDAAVALGMGVRIPVADEAGFDRLLVLGLRLSADEAESTELLTELIDNHHFAADGMSLLPQGSPTNNTAGHPAAYRRIDPAAEASFAVETGDPLFAPIAERAGKTDGQRLAEALGIEPGPLQHLADADAKDHGEALAMNTALWPATLGYYLEEMIEAEGTTIRDTRLFMSSHVTARGPLPAIRVGTQPYGVLPTSAMSRWRSSREVDGERFGYLERLRSVLARGEPRWSQLVSQVARVGAAGDPFQNLLALLGLHASSVERHRRHATGGTYTWNYHVFAHPGPAATAIHDAMRVEAEAVAGGLGLGIDPRAKILDLTFLDGQDLITDAFVADVEQGADERFSETVPLVAKYAVGDERVANYIGWMLASEIDVIKRQRFLDAEGEPLTRPRALLYRLLRRALLLGYHDATVQLYVNEGAADAVIAREIELPNVRTERTVTRWELMEAPLQAVVADGNTPQVSIVEFFQSPAGLARPEANDLGAVRAALDVLGSLPTARLERLFAEHLDLCSYRLDAWETALVARRLERLRVERVDDVEMPVPGIHLGAYGWLENVRPRGAAAEVDPAELPPSLVDAGTGPIVEQPGNGGFIHGPSLNHAVTAAVLRNGYLTHGDEDHPERFAVNLSSERVRKALGLLEGVRNGQELGALLGYEFERGLHDRHGLTDGEALDQFILGFRTAYPMVADKITDDPDAGQIETKEARTVFDGYALAEAIMVREPPLEYPYDVDGLPPEDSDAGRAIIDEIDRMVACLDAVADLGLAEGVFQVTQGNYGRGGAMLRALTEGTNPPEPEIVRTPRSGTTVGHRVAVHLAPDADPGQWPGEPTPRAVAAPGLNELAGRLLGPPGDIRFVLEFADAAGSPDVGRTIADLGIQPLDLVAMTGDDVNLPDGGSDAAATGTADDTTELESRIAHAYRRHRDGLGDEDLGELRIRFMVPDRPPSWDASATTIFELMPLLAGLRELIAARPLGADDYRLPSEATTDPDVDPNPAGVDVADLRSRIDAAMQSLHERIQLLTAARVAAAAPGAGDAELDVLRDRLRAVADHGLPDAFPRDAVGSPAEAGALLIAQADAVVALATARLDTATVLVELTDLEPEAQATLTVADLVERYRQAARLVLGEAFNLIPSFVFSDPDELDAAAAFGTVGSPGGLTRFSNNPFVVDEWLQGLAPVRRRIDRLEAVRLYADVFARPALALTPLQLPFRPGDHWVAVEYPSPDPDDADAFRPRGEYLSIVHAPAGAGFDPRVAQAGLVVDDWNELIPGTTETTGIAINYDQPGSEPPQSLLLAVTPEVTGRWSWDDLVETVIDTFDRAKRRAVEPDQIGDTPFGQVLPAILTAVTTPPFATISTDLVAATELAFEGDGDG